MEHSWIRSLQAFFDARLRTTPYRVASASAPLVASPALPLNTQYIIDGVALAIIDNPALAAESFAAVTNHVRACSGRLDARIPGGPDGHEFFDRFDAAVAQVAAAHDDTAVVFSHGAAIRAWVGARALNVSGEFTLKNPLDNTGIAIVEGSPERGWNLVSWAGAPIGGAQLADATAPDPTGETTIE